MKTTESRRKSKLPDVLDALRGNRHFEAYLVEQDEACGYGRTVFKADSNQSAFAQGRQSWANDVHETIQALKTEAEANQTK
jgi:hypothetical protein